MLRDSAFQRFIAQGNCPRKVSFGAVSNVAPGVFTIPHGSITSDGVVCTSASAMTVVPYSEGVAGELQSLLAEDAILDATFTALQDANASFLVGFENQQRVCGDASTAQLSPAVTLFINEPAGVAVPSVAFLRPVQGGYMIESAAAAEDDSVCFPGDATVEVKLRGRVAMANLAIGDVVRVAAGTDAAAWSPVYFFSHKVPAGGAAHAYVTLTTASGAALTLTPGHYVMADGVATAAGTVAVGQTLTTASGERSAVTAVGRSVARGGLYNPHTLAGTVMVDGVLASTYTTAVHPTVAAGLLAPLRAAWRAGLSVGGGWLDGARAGRAAAVAALPSGPSVCAA
ncbi:hypothetical protein I4F81_005890 [Pyropia yezoensis]|uniref:Uncharacterized protein n=1 Tax=Pyropia yezoensis TaxID=2788 RepID=A0ACC3BZK5_PYRYE|nr:hypothetical protein I4F81_005890 [Neopyropia yezoensis]